MERDRFDHKVDLTVDNKSNDIQRLEVISGVGRRRKWPDDFNAQVVTESLGPGIVISEITRRHGLRPQQSFTWRNQMRSARAEAAAGSRQFARVVAVSAAAIVWLILGPYSVPAAY